MSVYLITGSSRGIGAALAERLAAPGRVIGINYLKSDAAAKKVAKACEKKGAKALLLKADAAEPAAVAAMFEKLPEPPEVLVLNAGLPPRYARLTENSPEDFEAQWRAQAYSAALCCRAALPGMLKRKSGRIVFVVSTAAEGKAPGFLSAYVSAKYALLGLARALESEVGSRGIDVKVCFPGMTETDMIKGFPRPIVDAARDEGKLSKPTDVAEALARLAA